MFCKVSVVFPGSVFVELSAAARFGTYKITKIYITFDIRVVNKHERERERWTKKLPRTSRTSFTKLIVNTLQVIRQFNDLGQQ